MTFFNGQNVVGVFDLHERDALECQKPLSEEWLKICHYLTYVCLYREPPRIIKISLVFKKSVYHIPLRATDTSQSCCKGMKARPDVFWDLELTFKYFLCLKKGHKQCTFFKLEIISDKSGYQKYNYLEIMLLMSNLLKHANYLNTGMKSRKIPLGFGDFLFGRCDKERSLWRQRKKPLATKIRASGEPCMKCSSHVTI